MKKLYSMLVATIVGGVLMSSADAARAAEGTFKVSEFTFATPEGWKKEQPKSSMRKAQLSAPGKDGAKDAEVTFFYFGPSSGGGVQANVSRWFGQFKDRKNEKAEEKTVGGVKVTYVTTDGTFMSGPPFGGPKTPVPNSSLLGAIVEGKNGSVFVKMTGPSATVKGSDAGFRGMIEGALK